MKGMTEQVFVENRVEEGDKEKKKKRRSRRSKVPNSSTSGTSYSSVNGTHGEATEWLGNGSASNNGSMSTKSSPLQKGGLDSHALSDQGLSRALTGGFSSLPTMHISDEATDLGSIDQCQLEGTVFSKSCPEPICHEETAFSNYINAPYQENELYTDLQRKYFARYWSTETVNEAIQNGDVFRASFRVNAHNRLEAYCTIDGVPTDVLISGVVAQNRAVEGDIVAVKLDPFAYWTRLKGSAGHINNSAPLDDSNLPPKVFQVVGNNCKGKEKLVDDCEPNGHISSSSDPSSIGCAHELKEVSKAIGNICAMIRSFPTKRPTGTVVAIIENSPRRDGIVGFLGVNQRLSYGKWYEKECKIKKNSVSSSYQEFIQFTPNDAKFPKMLVSFRNLPDCIKKRLMEGDAMVEKELVAARIDYWGEDNLLPQARVIHIFGRGGEIETQVAAILFENAICCTEFSPESLSYLPHGQWQVPVEELERRRDLRNLCTFTIDPCTATDLDDALSIERVSDGIFRVGIHIADVSCFVLPGTPLDIEAQTRCTSVYLRQHKLSMLPPLLSKNVASLNPGVDRLAFSIIFDCNLSGDVVDRWIGHTVVRSCCKLSYQHAQDIIDGLMDVESHSTSVSRYPKLYGQYEWKDVIGSVKSLYKISKRLKENRFKDGAIHLQSSKPFFLFDECGIPYDSMLCEQTDSNFLVEEFMLLANRTAAEVISRAFPDCALLRRHPEPNGRKLREFEAFCRKHDLELDTSSSGQFNFSLCKIREKLKNDPVLFDILMSYASRPMQSATYFCTGDFKSRENEWAHYALAMPLYTHFTSPLRRYPDIVVHRTLSAAIEAEDMYLQQQRMMPKASEGEEVMRKCFSNLRFDSDMAESKECREALEAAALKHRVPSREILAEVAAYCNEKRLASRHAEDAGGKLYLWVLLKKKETLITEARVLGLGPKFMSIYIHKLAIERRICYEEVEGLTVEWLETTSTLVLNYCTNRRTLRRGNPRKCRPLEDVAFVINPCDLEAEQVVFENSGNEVGTSREAGGTGIAHNHGPSDEPGISGINEIDPAAFPLTLRIFSTIHVALHAIGGDDGPLDIGARLYTCSYFR